VRLVHAHAIFEQRAGCPQVARQLFAEASEMDPANAYVSHAWGQLEEALGNVSAAQRIYADLMARRPQAQVCCAWSALDEHERHLGRARAIYRQGWAV
jgi:predicted Zn-dependent protease